MKVFRHTAATRELNDLTKKHRSVLTDVERFERILASDTIVGHVLMSGLGLRRDDRPARIFKARVHCPAFNKGKSAGLRYVYERLAIREEECAVLLTIYLHQEGDREHAVRDRIKARHADYTSDDHRQHCLWESIL